jgi:hypothetical protein
MNSPIYPYIYLIVVLRRIKEKLRHSELMVAGDQWLIFLFHGYSYDLEDPWNGLLRSQLLVSVSYAELGWNTYLLENQAYKHIFTSPSSVEKEPKVTRSGNACIHGMTNVTPTSVAYVATQVGFFHFFLVFKIVP